MSFYFVGIVVSGRNTLLVNLHHMISEIECKNHLEKGYATVDDHHFSVIILSTKYITPALHEYLNEDTQSKHAKSLNGVRFSSMHFGHS